MSKLNRYSTEVQERAVRMVLDNENEYNSRWAATVPYPLLIAAIWIFP